MTINPGLSGLSFHTNGTFEPYTAPLQDPSQVRPVPAATLLAVTECLHPHRVHCLSETLSRAGVDHTHVHVSRYFHRLVALMCYVVEPLDSSWVDSVTLTDVQHTYAGHSKTDLDASILHLLRHLYTSCAGAPFRADDTSVFTSPPDYLILHLINTNVRIFTTSRRERVPHQPSQFHNYVQTIVNTSLKSILQSSTGDPWTSVTVPTPPIFTYTPYTPAPTPFSDLHVLRVNETFTIPGSIDRRPNTGSLLSGIDIEYPQVLACILSHPSIVDYNTYSALEDLSELPGLISDDESDDDDALPPPLPAPGLPHPAPQDLAAAAAAANFAATPPLHCPPGWQHQTHHLRLRRQRHHHQPPAQAP